MLLAIKVLHLLGLSMLLGGGICNAVLLGRAGTGDDAVRTTLRSAARRIGQIGFIGLLLLWGSGIYMVAHSGGDWMDFPALFWGKLVAVVLLSVSALAAQMYSLVAIFSGSRTPRQKVIRLTAITTLLTLLALILAVWAFDGGHAAPTADMPAQMPEAAPTAAPADAPAADPGSDTGADSGADTGAGSETDAASDPAAPSPERPLDLTTEPSGS